MRNSPSIRSRLGESSMRYAACLVALCFALTASAASTPTAAAIHAEKAPCRDATQTTPPICLPRTEDEIWCVSTRGLGCPDCEPTPQFGVWQHDCKAGHWNSSSLKSFLAADVPTKRTVFWIHGNRLDACYVRSQGLSIYHQLTNGVSGELPVRFVIFSWPADPTKGLVEDARRKAARTNADGYYLAWLVNQIDGNVPVSFVGHSFGARIATGALQLLAGGPLMGRVLPEPIAKRAPMEAVLLAAAVDNTWLAIGWPHGEALAAVDAMLAMNNHCDMALKRYPKINCTQALGYTGAYGPLGDNGAKLRQIDVCCNIGKSHDWESYFYTPNLVWQMRPYLGLSR
ncbi:MAG: hypothetical protein IT427_11370 [Pirellulales bacterium]|nr:hypothetical protein [Pirellulales bacterium]